jgi:uncharacterized membrane-anchored protein
MDGFASVCRINLMPTVLLMAFLCVSVQARQWTDSRGRKVEAELISFDGKNVTLKTASGKTSTFPVTNLSVQDQDHVRKTYGGTQGTGAASAAPQTSASNAAPSNPNVIPEGLRSYGVKPGPLEGQLGKEATINVPRGFAYADKNGTKGLLEDGGNPTNGQELAIVAPCNFDWFVVFEFDDCGYVKDDEKDTLDADALLKAITKGTEAANRHRRKMGVPELHITGWHMKPAYNPSTHNLEWAILGESAGEQVVNYNVRLLGRRGVMEASLVAAPSQMRAALPGFRQLLAAFNYNSGNSYGDYVKGDKIAKYGLAALIAGGGLAVAAKTGLLRPILKLIWLPFVIIGGFFKKLFGGGRDDR